MTTQRPWTHRVVYDVSFELDLGNNLRNIAEWAADEIATQLTQFLQSHTDFRHATVRAIKAFDIRCTFCGHLYEEDEEGPACCDRAIEAWGEAGPGARP